VNPLIPEAPSHAKGGRPRMEDRKAFEAIIYVLRTGIQWNALPCELGGASTTVHDHFQEWERAGFFKALWQAIVCLMPKNGLGRGCPLVFVGVLPVLKKPFCCSPGVTIFVLF